MTWNDVDDVVAELADADFTFAERATDDAFAAWKLRQFQRAMRPAVEQWRALFDRRGCGDILDAALDHGGGLRPDRMAKMLTALRERLAPASASS